MKKRSRLITMISISLLTVFVLIGSVQANPLIPNVTRLFGQDRIQTSIAVAQQGFKGNQLQNVIIASGYSFPDALAASTLASKLKAPIILAGHSVTHSQVSLDYIKSSIVAGGTVTIVGGSAVVPIEVEQWLRKSGYKVVRLGGKDRFATNSLIVSELNVASGTPVIIASGNNFPDALGIASIAASKGWPVLLSGPNELPDSVKTFLATKQPSHAYIVGGEAILSKAILGQIHKVSPDTKIKRFGGHDRFDTLAQVVTTFYPNPTEIYLANGFDFADALSGSINAAQRNAPILLIDPRANTLPPAIREYLVNHYDPKELIKINVLGGIAAVPELAVELVNISIGNSTKPYPTPAPTQLLAEKQLMLDLVNQERSNAGLGPLKFEEKLQKMAQAKSDDMVANSYFDHNSPTYGSPFEMMKTFGISYRAAGENLAGNVSVQAAHTALMNSPGHKANILHTSYGHIGIGIAIDPKGLIITQAFTN